MSLGFPVTHMVLLAYLKIDSVTGQTTKFALLPVIAHRPGDPPLGIPVDLESSWYPRLTTP